jgi:ABC-2 type transport system permease protein
MSTQSLAAGGRTLPVSLALMKRNLMALVRLPSALVPSLIFPIFGTIAFSSVYGAAIKQYFPTLPTLNWYVPLNVLQGVAFGSVFVAFGPIRDFMSGVFDRLLLAPIARRALLFSSIATGVVRALLPFVIVVVIGALGGMSLPGGAMALVMLLVTTLCVALIGVCWGLGIAYRFKSYASGGIMQIGVFVLVFLSESQVPARGLSGWLTWVAKVNPATRLLRMGRQGFLGPVTWAETWPGLLAFVGMFAVVFAFAARGLRKVVR